MARSRIPSREEHAQLWAKLAPADRRRIMRSVTRGQGLTNRREARLGVGVARQQQRYWRYAWLIGPAMGLIQLPDPVGVAITALLGILTMGGLSVFRIRRATAAEAANLERLGAH